MSNVFDISSARNEIIIESLGKQAANRILHSAAEIDAMAQHANELRPHLKSPEALHCLQTLEGRLASYLVNNEVDCIVDLALSVPNQTEKETLLNRIATLWYHQALSPENRDFISVAMQKLFPSSKTSDVLNNAHNARLSEESFMPSSVSSEEWENADFAFDLCELAHLFYQNKIQEAQKKLRKFTPEQQQRLKEICLSLGAEDPATFTQADLSEYRGQIMGFVQALVGYAHEVAQGKALNFYPSISEIHMMFSEAEGFSTEG